MGVASAAFCRAAAARGARTVKANRQAIIFKRSDTSSQSMELRCHVRAPPHHGSAIESSVPTNDSHHTPRPPVWQAFRAAPCSAFGARPVYNLFLIQAAMISTQEKL